MAPRWQLSRGGARWTRQEPNSNDFCSPRISASTTSRNAGTIVRMTLQQWERATSAPLMAAAVAFLAAYAIPVLRPGLDDQLLLVFTVITWVTWALFALDYLARFALAPDRRQYFLRHILDLVIIALPLLRPLRLLRLVSLLNVLNRRAAASLRGRLVVYALGGAALLGFCGSLAVLDAERANADANITTFADASWWAISTMTTVGYGDRYPTTGTGRLAAVALMLGGIAVLGVVTATLASWLVEQVAASEEQQTATLRAEIQRLEAEVAKLGLARGHEGDD